MSGSKAGLAEKFLDYINDDFFIDIVKNELKIKQEDFKLRLVLLEPATGANENYTSILYRAIIKIEFKDGKRETVKVIVKAMLDFMPEEFKKFNVFYRERRLYEKFLPIFEATWKSAGTEIQFGPRWVPSNNPIDSI
jgi:hypothetical protein